MTHASCDVVRSFSQFIGFLELHLTLLVGYKILEDYFHSEASLRYAYLNSGLIGFYLLQSVIEFLSQK